MLFVAASALPLMALLALQRRPAATVLGGYGVIGKPNLQPELLPGIAGLAVQPTRGLLVFSPFLLFLVLAGGSCRAVAKSGS